MSTEDLGNLMFGWPEIAEFATRYPCSYERAVVILVNRGLDWTAEHDNF